MNKFFNVIFFSFFIFIYAFTNTLHAAEVQTTQSQNNAYEQLVHCTFEDKLLVAYSITVNDPNNKIKTEDCPKQFVDALNSIEENKFVKLFQQLSRDEQLKFFSHWIVDEAMQLSGYTLTKQFLLMFTCNDGSFLLDSFSGEYDETDESESNRYIDPAYYDLLLDKIKKSPQLEKLRFLTILCAPEFSVVTREAIMELFSDEKTKFTGDFYDLSCKETLQLLNYADNSLNLTESYVKNLLANYSLKNKLQPEDLNNENIVALVKKIENEKIRPEDFFEEKDQFSSSEVLLKEFKKQPKQEQLKILMDSFYAVAFLRLTELYSRELETL